MSISPGRCPSRIGRRPATDTRTPIATRTNPATINVRPSGIPSVCAFSADGDQHVASVIDRIDEARTEFALGALLELLPDAVAELHPHVARLKAAVADRQEIGDGHSGAVLEPVDLDALE